MPVDSFNDEVSALESIDGARRAKVCAHGGGVRTMAPPGDHDVDAELVAEMTYMAGEFLTLRSKAKPHFDMSEAKPHFDMSDGKNGDFTVSVYL